MVVLAAAESDGNAGVNTPGPVADNRPSCRDSSSAMKANHTDTASRLLQLRTAMASVKIVRGVPLKAYIITSDDEHQV